MQKCAFYQIKDLIKYTFTASWMNFNPTILAQVKKQNSFSNSMNTYMAGEK